MPLGQRVLTVTFSGPQLGGGTVTLDETLDLKVKIIKGALAIHNKCEILVSNLSVSLRTSLLSQFTAWNRRSVDTNQSAATQTSYVNVVVSAGNNNPGQPSTVVPIFKGQVVLCEPVGDLPNMAVSIGCYSQQIDKTNFQVQVPPGNMTFKAYAQFVADQMGVNLLCETSYDSRVITNPGASIHVVSDLIIDLQSYYRPAVAAFVDSSTNTLVVRDVNKVITSANTVTVDEFIGMPLWTEWGVKLKTLFNPQIQMTSAVQLKSVLNPSLNDVAYVAYALEYDLTSRDTAFYVTVNAAPPA